MRHICNIREKIEDDPGQPLYIQTVRGVGYQEQEFKNNELVNVESDSKETNDDYTDDLYDAYTDDSENE